MIGLGAMERNQLNKTEQRTIHFLWLFVLPGKEAMFYTHHSVEDFQYWKKILLYCKGISCNEDRRRGFLKSVSVLIYYTHSVKRTRIDPQLERFIKAHCHGISIFRSSVGILVSIIVCWNFYANLWQLLSHFSQILSEIQVFKLDIYP